jgi:hypothetical protein
MSKLSKTSNGLFFFEDFSEKSLQWSLSPSDSVCVSFGDNGLQMKHNKHYTTYTIVEPSVSEYSCIVNLDHIPRSLNDIAGILVMSSTKEYAECQSHMATGPSELGNSETLNLDIENLISKLNSNYVQWSLNDEEFLEEDEYSQSTGTGVFVDTLYHYIKINKNKYKYVFWASDDGYKWIEIGNVKFEDSGVIGFFIYGTEDKDIIDNSHCYFKTFALYKSKFMTITGIDRKQELEIYDKNGVIIMRTDNVVFSHLFSRSNKQCIINTLTLPMPIQDGTLRLYSRDNYEVTLGEYQLGDIYGGDGFTIERDIRLYINQKEINPLELYDLGTFYHGSYYIKLDVCNHEDYILNDIIVKVIRYSEYYGGEEEIAIALYNEEQIESELQYEKQIVIDSLAPSESQSIFMKLVDKPTQGFYSTANDYRFKIIIE